MTNGEITLRITIGPLCDQLAQLKDEPITNMYISRQTGLAYNTIRFIDTNRRFDLRVLERLLAFFRDEGLDVSAGDLFEEANGAESNNL